jgi:phosphoglycerate kinase
VDFNVPLNKNLIITDDSRIVAALPTIKKVISDGGKAIIISHLGRPKNGFEEKFSLKNTSNHLAKLLKIPVGFSNDCIGKITTSDVEKMNNGDVRVLENLRFYSEEKNGDTGFAKKLAAFGDVYINDAFGTAHRAHASTSIITKFFTNNKYFGFLFAKEVNCLKKVLSITEKPFTAIIGGAKITGKIDVIKALLNKVDNLIIGGGMAYTFAKAIGGDIGKSLVENKKVTQAKILINEAKKQRG